MNCRRAIYALLAVAAAGFAGAVGLYSGSEPARHRLPRLRSSSSASILRRSGARARP
jgi:hypothetical protein